MIADYVRFVVRGLMHRKLRSWLTVIGILIGVTAVIALISLGTGMNTAIGELFKSIGSDKIFVSAGGASLGPTGASLTSAEITEHDENIISGVRGVEKVIGVLIEQARVQVHGQTKYTSVVGISTDRDVVNILNTIDFYMIKNGRQLKNGDKYKAVVGNTISVDFFDKPLKLSDNIEIENQEFQVVGIQKKSGSPIHDPMVRIPINTARELFNEPEAFSMMIVKIKSGFNPEIVAQEIEKTMRKDRGLEEGKEDFSVETAQNTIQGVSTILTVVQVALIGIAGISIVVGGIGIMNTTYTSVFERTKEIGIMKAIGAKNSDIVMLFLIEAGILGLIGGAIGVAIGAGLAKAVELAAANFGAELLKAAITPGLVAGALLFSFGVGAVSGVLPALKAAKLNVIEAIQHG